jgi:hypothetical protein
MMSINDTRKKRGRGRPPTGSLQIGLRLEPKIVEAIDAFIASQPDPKPTRPEAIRQIVTDRLEAKS